MFAWVALSGDGDGRTYYMTSGPPGWLAPGGDYPSDGPGHEPANRTRASRAGASWTPRVPPEIMGLRPPRGSRDAAAAPGLPARLAGLAGLRCARAAAPQEGGR